MHTSEDPPGLRPSRPASHVRKAVIRRTIPLLLAAASLIVVLASPLTAEGIPAFSRKYGTSCTTCHVAFPKLNAFGEAFRLNGYRYPEEAVAHVKEEPVSLGAPAWKRVWPDGVWPGSIPGTTPLAIRAVMRDRYASFIEDGVKETVRNDFEFPSEMEFLAAGTTGDDMSFFLAVEWEPEVSHGETETEVDVHQAELHWNDLFKKENLLNFKVGYFEPEAVGGFSHMRRLTFADYAPLYAYEPIEHGGGTGLSGGHHGARGRAMPRTVTGLEIYGIVSRRLLYSAGIGAGLGPGEETFDGNGSKDIFGRLAYKFGGMALDGTVPGDEEDTAASSTEPWVDDSIRVGVFGYLGDGEGIAFDVAHAGDPPELLEDVRFHRVGVDLSWYIGSLNLFGTYLSGSDELREAGMPSTETSHTYEALFVEGDYVFMPWLVGAVRYEQLDPAAAGADPFRRVIPGVTALLRANVKLVGEFQKDLVQDRTYTFLLGVDFAF